MLWSLTCQKVLLTWEDQHRESAFTTSTSPSRAGTSPSTSPVLTPLEYNGSSIEDILRLPAEAIDNLCNIWFLHYHPWFPILHKLSFLEYLENRNTQNDSVCLLVLKAILAVTLSHGLSTELMTKERRDEVVSALQKEILIHISTNLSLSSLQAGLIVTIVDYGAGNLHAFWNEIAVCKRYETIDRYPSNDIKM